MGNSVIVHSIGCGCHEEAPRFVVNGLAACAY
ncbi:conserved hypothetical protein [Acidithiobacillus caldus SM-1]|uniref:Uncharacterized protein n=2 Tax=Acidithiobacillus caldus TaxID=33059 RepID=F9ZNH1_ACICS|nr:conserved hypothetical protein [Acidithiobacillus caldus SM-1]